MKSEMKPDTGTVAKVPQIQKNDSGAYVCMVRPWSTSRNIVFPFNVEVTVDGEQFENVSLNLPALASVSEAPAAALFIQASCSHNSSKYLLQESIFQKSMEEL